MFKFNGPCCYICEHSLKNQQNLLKPYFFENGTVYEKITIKNCNNCKSVIKDINSDQINNFLNLKLENDICGFCNNCNHFVKNNEIFETYEKKEYITQITSGCLCEWRLNNF